MYTLTKYDREILSKPSYTADAMAGTLMRDPAMKRLLHSSVQDGGLEDFSDFVLTMGEKEKSSMILAEVDGIRRRISDCLAALQHDRHGKSEGRPSGLEQVSRWLRECLVSLGKVQSVEMFSMFRRRGDFSK